MRSDKSEKGKEKQNKEELFIPNFTLLLALVWFLVGAYPGFSCMSTAKRCTAETTGIVFSQSHRDRGADHTVQDKYAVGKYQRCVKVETDGCFDHERLYASTNIGDIGEEVIIRYDPDDPDVYYFADYYSNGKVFAILAWGLSGINIILSVIFFIYYNIPLVFPKKKKEDQGQC